MCIHFLLMNEDFLADQQGCKSICRRSALSPATSCSGINKETGARLRAVLFGRNSLIIYSKHMNATPFPSKENTWIENKNKTQYTQGWYYYHYYYNCCYYCANSSRGPFLSTPCHPSSPRISGLWLLRSPEYIYRLSFLYVRPSVYVLPSVSWGAVNGIWAEVWLKGHFLLGDHPTVSLFSSPLFLRASETLGIWEQKGLIAGSHGAS